MPARTRWTAILAVSLTVLAATAAWTVHDADSSPSAPARAGTGKPIRPAQFGFALGGNGHELTPDVLGTELNTIRRAGGRWVRLDINWDVVQREGRRSLYWLPFDNLVAAARARGLNVLATILYTPPWARPEGQDASWAPRPRDFARFVGEAVKHYAPMGVHTWELWNEPNHPPFFQPRPKPKRYAAMLKAAYPVVHRHDAKATVVTGGTSPGPTAPGRYNAVDWLAALYANGAGDSFDAVAQHAATFPGLPGAAKPRAPGIRCTARARACAACSSATAMRTRRSG